MSFVQSARHFSCMAFAAVAVAIGAHPAAAQVFDTQFLQSEIPFDYNRGRNVSVVERERPEYDALGIKSGGTTIYPRLQVGGGYTDNVFGSSVSKDDDFFATVSPTVSIQSDWSRHALNFNGGAQFNRYADAKVKNTDGWSVATDGRLDVFGESYITAGVRARRAEEERSSGSFPDDVAESVQYRNGNGFLRLHYQGPRVRVILSTDYNTFDFKDALRFNGTVSDQDNRDRDIWRTGGRAEYALTPDTSAFVQLSYADVSYDQPTINGVTPNRDSKEIRALAGASFDLTALLRGSIGLGYVRRNYDFAPYRTISGLAVDARLEYFVTQLTTISLSGRRYIEDSTVGISGGAFNTGVSLRVDHELLRNLLINAEGEYSHLKYKGVNVLGDDRSDDVYRMTGGATYFMNRTVGVSGSVSYLDRKSSGTFPGNDYDETRAMLALVFQI